MSDGPPSLPYGWVQEMDRTYNHPYYVDTNVKPPRATWGHPYEDAQYLCEHPEVREILGKRLTVRKLTADRSHLDITKYIYRDAKEHQFPIGVGAGGNVFRGIYRWIDPSTEQVQNLNVVIKCLVGTPEQKLKIEKRLDREIATWRGLKHPNVSEFLGIAYVNPALPPGLVSRWVLRHNFLEYIGRHPEQKRKKAQEVVCGVQYLHAQGVVHGDLKVDNVLISDQLRAQITDFGIARILDVSGYSTMTQRNIRYTAPELMPIVMDEDAPDERPTLQSDIFSLGILLLQLFHGPDQDLQRGLPYNHVPYNRRAFDFPLQKLIHKGERPIRNRYNWMHDVHWKLIERCWVDKPFDRPVIAEVLQTL